MVPLGDEHDGLLWANPNRRDDTSPPRKAREPAFTVDEDPKAEETRLDQVYAEAAAESSRGRQ